MLGRILDRFLSAFSYLRAVLDGSGLNDDGFKSSIGLGLGHERNEAMKP